MILIFRRGLTPPHRVKSMSMATFTTEEMEYLHERGNDYCKQVWLQLFEGNVLTESNDEQDIKDFMIQKYERKRYYVDPKLVTNLQTNNKKHSTTTNNNNNNKFSNNNNEQLKKNKSSTDDFVADFSKADIFIAEPLNKSTNKNGFVQQQPQQQASFANFDNNPIFINNSASK